MADDSKTGKFNVSHSVPCSPVVKDVTKSDFLSKLPIPKITEFKWVWGAPTPVAQGSMSPNEQAITLLAGFASGSVKMDGDSLRHLPAIPEKSINETLNEIPWETPKQKRIDGKANHSKKPKIAQIEPRKTIAKQLAEQKPRTKISEIGVKNIIQGSPIYIPYHHVKPKVTGKGKGVKILNLSRKINKVLILAVPTWPELSAQKLKRKKLKRRKKNVNERSITTGPRKGLGDRSGYQRGRKVTKGP